MREAGKEVNIERFIAERISGKELSKQAISKPIVKIGIIGISTGMAVMLLTVSIVLGFKTEISKRITSLSAEILLKSRQGVSGTESSALLISDSVRTAIEALPFVKKVQKVAFKNGILKTDTENEGLLLKGVEEGSDLDFLGSKLIKGRLMDWPRHDICNEILISKSLADRLQLDCGKKILVFFIGQKQEYDSLTQKSYTRFEKRSRNFTVSGIFKTDFSDFDQSLGIIDLRHIQKLNYWNRGEAGAYEIKTTGIAGLEIQAEQVQEICGYGLSVQTVKDVYSNIFTWLDKLDVNGIIIVILMILVATVNMITALLILILERTTMVGLLKTLGLSGQRVRNIFLWISLRLIGRGLLIGNLVGIALCALQYKFEMVKLNPQTYYVDHVAMEFNWTYMLILNAGTLLVCMLMLLLPTLILNRLSPAKTLRFD
ncbi:MAG TPA: ABC transporter permease [Bacteroidia bacterium]|nr:ABC transporter permease [Bacteroidia bacterium]